MDKTEFYNFLNNLIIPIFTGSFVAGEIASTPRDMEVALGKGDTVLLKPTKADEYRVILKRGQPFKSTEVNLIRAILKEITEISAYGINDNVYMKKLQSLAIEKALIESITDTASETIIGIINLLEAWSSRTYEGVNVSAGIFVNLAIPAEGNESTGETYANILGKDFFALLTDGVSSFIEFDKNGALLGYTNLKSAKFAQTVSPYVYDRVARVCGDKKIGIVLTDKGDILIFHARQLMFARRAGKWCVYSHDEVIRLLYTNVSYTTKQIRRAIYNTALDCSFSYKGACIVYLNKDKTYDALKHIDSADIISSAHFEIKKRIELEEADKLYNLANSAKIRETFDCTFEDYMDRNSCVKSKALTTIIAGKKIHELDRKLLEEIVSIDGATIVDFDGTIIAVGAIIKIEAGSLGGGRLAATKSMAKYGIGIKVSQDGVMQGFGVDKHGKVKQIFSVG